MKVGYQHITHEVSLYQKKNNIAQCANNQQYNQMIMKAVFYDVWPCGRSLKYYYYIPMGDLGTAME